MADLTMDAINEAFCSEIRHTYSITSRDYASHGGLEGGAKVLLKRIKTLQDFHNIIIDLLNNGENDDDGPG